MLGKEDEVIEWDIGRGSIIFLVRAQLFRVQTLSVHDVYKHYDIGVYSLKT
jgi:hypothetical protein